MNSRLKYIQDLEFQINEAEITLRQLKDQREQTLQDAQHEEIEQLETHLSHAQIHLSDIRDAAEEAWAELQSGLDEVMTQIRESLAKLR